MDEDIDEEIEFVMLRVCVGVALEVGVTEGDPAISDPRKIDPTKLSWLGAPTTILGTPLPSRSPT